MILVLDVDGVVVTGHRDGGRWDKRLERDLKLSTDLLQEHFFGPFWPSILVGDSDLYETLARVWPQMECTVDVRTFVDYWFAADSKVDHGLTALVDDWRRAGGRCCLATNQEHHRARYLWERLQLVRHFDEMIYSADLHVAKPDALFFTRAFERLSATSPAEIRFLDDSLRNVEAAATAGWLARHYCGLDDLRSALMDS
jgi:putative hydrolase of the HAD superfamily